MALHVHSSTVVAPPVQRLVLPVPPSTNRFYRFDRGNTHISTEGRLYKREVATMCFAAGVRMIYDGDVVLRLVWYRERRSGDVDNRLKQCLDALQGHLYGDDGQIADLRIERHEDKNKPRLEVLIARAGTPEARQILTCEFGGAR